MTRLTSVLIVAAALVLPGLAGAQEPAPAPAPAPEPLKAKLRLDVERVGSGGVLAGTRWVVRGTLRPHVAGQTATVRFYRRGRKIAVKQVAIGRTGSVGRFRLGFRARTPGTITVRASHRATPELDTAIAPRVRVAVLPLRATPGARGGAVRLLQQRLARLGYVVGRRGLYDERTARAVVAFRKVTGMARTNVAGEEVFRRLARGEGRFRVRFPSHGRHIEADISRQVLALIDGRRVLRIYPTSTGAPATPTILGTYRVYMKSYGTNAKGMVHSSYFIRGYAIHGYASVPIYNASHGCLRVPIPEADYIFDWVRLGTIVDTYR
jgi:peptidoglycan hydrolase-like protein with peptidoglycan-binding domain